MRPNSRSNCLRTLLLKGVWMDEKLSLVVSASTHSPLSWLVDFGRFWTSKSLSIVNFDLRWHYLIDDLVFRWLFWNSIKETKARSWSAFMFGNEKEIFWKEQKNLVSSKLLFWKLLEDYIYFLIYEDYFWIWNTLISYDYDFIKWHIIGLITIVFRRENIIKYLKHEWGKNVWRRLESHILLSCFSSGVIIIYIFYSVFMYIILIWC